SKLPPKRPIFIPIFPVIVPLVSSLPGKVASSVTRLCSLMADLYQRVLRKASYETTLWTRLLLSLSRCPQSIPDGVYLWPLCRQETAVDCRNSLCARSAHSMNYAYETPPHPQLGRSSGARSYPALRGRSPQHRPGADSNLVFLRYRGEPPRRVRRRRDGQCLVRRMEARTRRHIFCAYRQRLLFARRRTDSHRVSQGHRAPRLVLRRGSADLLVQRRSPGYPGEPPPVREQLSLAGDERALWYLPLRRPRNPPGRKPRDGGYVWLRQRRGSNRQTSGKPVLRCPAMVSNRRLFSRPQGIQQPDHGVRP